MVSMTTSVFDLMRKLEMIGDIFPPPRAAGRGFAKYAEK